MSKTIKTIKSRTMLKKKQAKIVIIIKPRKMLMNKGTRVKKLRGIPRKPKK